MAKGLSTLQSLALERVFKHPGSDTYEVALAINRPIKQTRSTLENLVRRKRVRQQPPLDSNEYLSRWYPETPENA